MCAVIIRCRLLSEFIRCQTFWRDKSRDMGSTIGLLIGPFIIPVFGIILGPFLGAIIGEWIVHRSSFKKTIKVGIGSVVGFISSVFTKGLIQLVMVIYFFLVL
nr:DUF456 domain-containing protein [[Bacillus] enclensis]